MKTAPLCRIIFPGFFFLLILSKPSFAFQDCTRADYGDINNNGVINLDDILCVLQGFAGDHDCAPLSAQDIFPCSPSTGPIGDGFVNLSDILAMLHAFSGTSTCVGPCISCTNNQAPIANGGPDLNGQVGVPILFDASASTDPNGNSTLHSYWWNFGDGNFTGWQDSPTVLHTYASVGNYTARLWVRDQCEAMSNNDLIGVSISNSNPCIGNTPPNANAGPNQSASVGVVLNFNAMQSSDPGGGIISYQWNFGDGATANGIVVSHSYATAGVFTVTLTVSDNCSATGVDTAIATISNPNQAPLVNAGADQAISMPLVGNATIGLSGSYSDDGLPVGGLITKIWSSISGPAVPTFSNPLALDSSVTFPVAGIYTMRLTVHDGALMGSDEIRITVNPNVCANNVPPVANAGPDLQGSVGGLFSFNAAASSDSNGTIQSYVWNFGDGQSSSGLLVSHVYSSPGIYTVVLTVTDNCNATHSDQATVTVNQTSGELDAHFKVYRLGSIVNGQEQWIEVGASESVQMNEQLKIDATSSSGPIHFYSWQMGDGSFNSGSIVYYNYGNITVYNGYSQSFTIELMVFDSSWVHSDVFSRTLQVSSTMSFLDALALADNNSNDIAIDGNRAFTSHFNGKLTTLNITNPSSMQVLSLIDAPVGKAIAAANGNAYLCAGTVGLAIYQVGSAATPTWMATYNTASQDGQRAQDAAARGKVVFLAAGTAGFKILNMSNPASPAVLGFYVLPSNSSADVIMVSGGRAYVADVIGNIHIFNISAIDINNPSPASPTLMGTISLGRNVQHMSVTGNTVVAHAAPDGLFFYDVANPANAIFLGNYDISNDAVGLSPGGVAAIGNRVYVTFGQVLGIGSTVARVNIANPSEAYIMEWIALSSHQVSDINRGPVIHEGKLFFANAKYTAVALDILE